MIFFSFKPVNEYITRIFDLRTISFRSKAEATLNVFFSNELTILRQICKISRQITKVQRQMATAIVFTNSFVTLPYLRIVFV